MEDKWAFNLHLPPSDPPQIKEGVDIRLICFPVTNIGSKHGSKQSVSTQHNEWNPRLPHVPRSSRHLKNNKLWFIRAELGGMEDPESETTPTHQPLATAATERKAVGYEYEKLGIHPHVFETSSLAYLGLAVDGTDQTILVTGEVSPFHYFDGIATLLLLFYLKLHLFCQLSFTVPA